MAERLRACTAYCLGDGPVQQLPLDAFSAVRREGKAGDCREDEAITRLERSPEWVWTAMEPPRTWLLVIEVGTRTLERAPRVVPQVVQVLAPDCVPLVLPDGLPDYGMACRTHFGYGLQPERRQDKQPWPKPRWMALPQWLDAQVGPSSRCRRIVGVKHRVVFGTIDGVMQT